MVTSVRSTLYMPPQSWIIRIEPEQETLGQLLSRLRDERGWTQLQVAQRARVAQALYSKYELDRVAKPDDDILERLETVYGLSQDTLALAALRTQRMRRQPKTRLPGVSLAVAAEPGMEPLLEAVTQLEQDKKAATQAFAEFLASTNLPFGTPQERAETFAAFLALQKETEGSDEGTIG